MQTIGSNDFDCALLEVMIGNGMHLATMATWFMWCFANIAPRNQVEPLQPAVSLKPASSGVKIGEDEFDAGDKTGTDQFSAGL